jgi:carboxylesterase
VPAGVRVSKLVGAPRRTTSGTDAYDALVTSFLGRALKPRPASVEGSASSAQVLPGAEPYHGGTGRAGVLLLHGFTGSPFSMRPWAEHLVADGFRVAVPRLPGHGTDWQELAMTQWTDWYAAAEAELASLRQVCDQVFVGGLSMGGGLALLLAERHGAEIDGIVLVNAAVMSNDKRLVALPVLRHVIASLPGIANDIAKPGVNEGGYTRTPLDATYSMTKMWREIRDGLGRVQQPLLIFRSVVDHVVDPSSGRTILAAVSSSDVHEHLLRRSYHVATMDYEADDIFVGSSAFFSRLLKD